VGSGYCAPVANSRGVDSELRRAAALATHPEDELAACIQAGLCQEAVLAERNDTTVALVFDLTTRGEYERALEVEQRYLGVYSLKEKELWDAVVVALESRKNEMLKKAALNLLVYVAYPLFFPQKL